MKRLVAITTAATCVAAAAWAANGVTEQDGPTVIEIEVTADRLDDCRETLAQVAQMPAVHDNGTPILFGANDDLPTVACVAI